MLMLMQVVGGLGFIGGAVSAMAGMAHEAPEQGMIISLLGAICYACCSIAMDSSYETEQRKKERAAKPTRPSDRRSITATTPIPPTLD